MPARRRQVVSLAAIAVVLVVGLVVVALAGAGSSSRLARVAAPVAQTALEPERALPGSGLPRSAGPHQAPRGGAAGRHVDSHPVARFLTRAQGRVFDVRALRGSV